MLGYFACSNLTKAAMVFIWSPGFYFMIELGNRPKLKLISLEFSLTSVRKICSANSKIIQSATASPLTGLLHPRYNSVMLSTLAYLHTLFNFTSLAKNQLIYTRTATEKNCVIDNSFKVFNIPTS